MRYSCMIINSWEMNFRCFWSWLVFVLDQCAHMVNVLGLVYVMVIRNFAIGFTVIVEVIPIVFGYLVITLWVILCRMLILAKGGGSEWNRVSY